MKKDTSFNFRHILLNILGNPKKAAFWQLCFVLILVFHLVSYIYRDYIHAQQKWATVIDPAGNFYKVLLMPENMDKKMRRHCAWLSTVSAMETNPKGLDNDELFKLSWVNPGRRQFIEKYLKPRADLLRQREIYESVKVTDIQIVPESDTRIIVTSKGQIFRRGNYRGTDLPQLEDFTFTFRMAYNTDFSINKNLTWVAYQPLKKTTNPVVQVEVDK